MRNRFNVCAETAVTKAAAIIFPGVHLTYGDGNNDAQCDFAPLLVKIPGQDQAISNPRLGGQAAAVTQAHSHAIAKIRQESGLTDPAGRNESLEERETRLAGEDFDRIIALHSRADILAERRKFDHYVQRKLAPIMAPIQQILATELQKLIQPNVYMLRTGAEGGSGHFHTVYYEAPNWILDSGFKEGHPNIGILYNTQTRKLGPMAEQLIDPSHEWGRGQGKKRLDFFEMNPTRTLVAAKYIERYRALSREETELVFPEELINEIIAEPNYLSTLGSGHYWQAQQNGRRFTPPPVPAEHYIQTALQQCTQQGLSGAVNQLRIQGYFRNPTQGRALLATLLANNKLDAVNEILRQNLVDLTNPEHCARLYQSALEFSHEQPSGLHPSLRALQNKLLETLAPEDLPFGIQQACEALNLNALESMLTMGGEISHADLIELVNDSARECQSSPSTVQPILQVLHDHALSTRQPNLAQDSAEMDFDEPVIKEDEEAFIERAAPTDHFAKTIIALNQDNDLDPRDAWDLACDALKNREPYICAPENRSASGFRVIEYHAETTAGDTIINLVSENEQILLDELYAKKLEADEPFRLRR